MLSLLPLALAGLSSCGPLDLPSALVLAERRSDEVAIKQSELDAAQVNKSLARAARILPLATATLLGGPAPGAHGDVTHVTDGSTNYNPFHDLGPFGRVDINVVQPLFTWGQLDAARDAAQAGVDARTLLVRDQVEQVQLRVIQLYWAHALAKRFLVIAADVEKALGEAQKKVDEAVAADDPSIAVEDRYRITLFKAQLVARKSDAQKGVDMAQMGLAATLAVEPAELELADAPLVAPAPGNELAALPALVAQAASQRSDLLALDKAIVAKEAQASAAEGARFPSVFIAGTFTAAYAPGRDFQSNPWVSDPFNQLSGGVALGVRENLALPLLQAQLDQVRAELTTLRRQRQGLLRLVTVQVEGARIEAAAARERLIAAQSALGAGKSWFRAAALNFGLGVADAKALIDAYLGYVESQVGLATANYDVLVAVARLDQVTGTPLAHGDNPCVSR